MSFICGSCKGSCTFSKVSATWGFGAISQCQLQMPLPLPVTTAATIATTFTATTTTTLQLHYCTTKTLLPHDTTLHYISASTSNPSPTTTSPQLRLQLHLQLRYATLLLQLQLNYTTSSSCASGGHCNHSKTHSSNHLSAHFSGFRSAFWFPTLETAAVSLCGTAGNGLHRPGFYIVVPIVVAWLG